MNQSIEAVQVGEVEKLRNLSMFTFKTTFEHGVYTEDDFNSYFNEAFAVEQLTQELQNKDSYTYFYKEDNEIVGYFKLNINTAQTEPKGHEYLEVQRIYFIPQAQGGGKGKRVIKFAIEQAQRLNKTKIWLGVWEHNAQAFNFYKKQGFTVTGEHKFYTGDVIDTDLIMEKEV